MSNPLVADLQYQMAICTEAKKLAQQEGNDMLESFYELKMAKIEIEIDILNNSITLLN